MSNYNERCFIYPIASKLTSVLFTGSIMIQGVENFRVGDTEVGDTSSMEGWGFSGKGHFTAAFRSNSLDLSFHQSEICMYMCEWRRDVSLHLLGQPGQFTWCDGLRQVYISVPVTASNQTGPLNPVIFLRFKPSLFLSMSFWGMEEQ